ncbi:uncharacterized protein KZ484_021175 [Pholidichthys leucotaenia]
MLDTELEGQRSILKLNATAWPQLRLEGELHHDHPALRGLPNSSRIKLTSRTEKQRFDAEALIQMDECTVGASGAVMSQSGMQGSVVYHNNCTMIKEFGGPDIIQVSGSLVVSPAFVKSHLSMVTDNAGLQTLLFLKNTLENNEASLNFNHSVPLLMKLGLPLSSVVLMKSGSLSNGSYFYIVNTNTGNQRLSQEMTVVKTSESVRVKSHFIHTVNYLKKLGVPANNSIQVEFGSHEGKAVTLQSWFGGQLAGLRLKIKNIPMNKEIRGIMWHSWSWLRDRGLPVNLEGLCSIKGVLPQVQSRAQLTVDGHKRLTSGFNVSGTDGHLAVLFSYSPQAVNQTAPQNNLDALLTVQFRG